MLASEIIRKFLLANTHDDLSKLYSLEMECQVNVAQDGGTRVESDYKGRQWHGWTDGVETWKSFRIPYNAKSEPTYDDKPLFYNFDAHVEGIGMTGWDWKNRVSRWVAFDFDAITGHKKGLSSDDLSNVERVVENIPWVSIRRSTSGQGIHLYVYLSVPTANHSEHSALARSVLGTLAALTGYDFTSKVDICGGNMWVWHRKMRNTKGLSLIKPSIPLTDIPENWRTHIDVITGKRRRTYVQGVDRLAEFDDIITQSPDIELDDDHRKLIAWLDEHDYPWTWNSDINTLTTHTAHLAVAHEALGLKGIFKTISEGKDRNDHNCFMRPLRRGAWVVRRYSQGVNEDNTWTQDAGGWTRCYFNRELDLHTASACFQGIEDTDKGFVFRHAKDAMAAANLVGANMTLPAWALNKHEATLKEHKDGRLVFEMPRDSHDEHLEGWLEKKGKWRRIFHAQIFKGNSQEVGNFDDLIRHLVTESGQDHGWVVKSDNSWRVEPLVHAKAALEQFELNPKDVKSIIGNSVLKPWSIVVKPFEPEYPGGRQWNRQAPQLKFQPSTSEFLAYPHWLSILQHVGSGLDDSIKQNEWCKANGITTGADYLKCWIASLFQKPNEPLPYLFFFGPQNSGKSIFHEALSLLITRGYQRVDTALTNDSGFNGEMENSVLCIVEETDLRKNKAAYNRIKDWVTSRYITIHPKRIQPYDIPNTLHFIHTANELQECPVFPGDTRITMSYVGPLPEEQRIAKRDLIPRLEKEAPDFLAAVLNLEIPTSTDRLNVPVITTDDKRWAEKASQGPLETFIDESCHPSPGAMIPFPEFYDNFIKWLDPNEVPNWSKNKVSRGIPPQFKTAKDKVNKVFLLNISWTPPTVVSKTRLISINGLIERVENAGTTSNLAVEQAAT